MGGEVKRTYPVEMGYEGDLFACHTWFIDSGPVCGEQMEGRGTLPSQLGRFALALAHGNLPAACRSLPVSRWVVYGLGMWPAAAGPG
jgi:hypothetical protein